MEEFTSSKEPLGMGQKVARVRKLRRIKQEYLAEKLKISQTQVSNLEQQDEIEDDLLDQIAAILGVPVEFIKTFDEDRVTNIINNLYDVHDNEINDHATAIANQVTNNYSYDKKVDELQEVLNRALVALERSNNERDDFKKQYEDLKQKQ